MTEFSKEIDDVLNEGLSRIKSENSSNVRKSSNAKTKHDPAETPSLKMNGNEGTLTIEPMAADSAPDWSDVLAVWNLDPAIYEVVEPVGFNAWDAQKDGKIVRMCQYKARVKLRDASTQTAVLEDLIAEVKKRKSTKRTHTEVTGEGDFSVVLSDWQTGKGEGGGSAALVERVMTAIADVKHRYKELRKAGRKMDTLNVLWPGDSVEGCGDHYAMQTFQTDLDRKSQVQLAQRLLFEAIDVWSRDFARVRVIAVGGNHGENRKGGKAYTTFGDNDDLLVVENVAFACDQNPARFGHVEFIVPEDHLNAVVKIAGDAWTLGVTHGHLSRSGNTAENKISTWFAKQAAGKCAIGQVDILVTGHYHHLRMVDHGGWFWMQAPALDGGSEWFTQTSGQYSEPGVLTFASYPDKRVDDLKVL